MTPQTPLALSNLAATDLAVGRVFIVETVGPLAFAATKDDGLRAAAFAANAVVACDKDGAESCKIISLLRALADYVQ